MLDEVEECFVNIAREIAARQLLLIVTPEVESVRSRIANVVNMSNVRFVECRSNDTWARDHGGITVYDGEEPVVYDFAFNGWGLKFAACYDNLITSQLANRGVLHARYQNRLNFIIEGGSIESDGEGTVFTTTGCLMAPNRNQPLSQDEIEEELKKRLAADRILWIDHGDLVGDDTDGHIDTLVRVAPADTLLYMGCDDENDEQYEQLHKMEEDLRMLQTKSGRGYRLLRLPSPRPIYYDGEQFLDSPTDGAERLPATYANFLVINGAVLYPTYAQPDLDAEAAAVIADAFPDREIIGIDCRPIIIQHGSLHCCTMQFPAGVVVKAKTTE